MLKLVWNGEYFKLIKLLYLRKIIYFCFNFSFYLYKFNNYLFIKNYKIFLYILIDF